MSPNTRPPSPRPLHNAEEGAEHRRREAGEGSPPLPLPDKPSIAVLPFANMSGDPEQEYFVDGMVEEIITALSRIRWLFVIARNSSFTYKGRPVDVKEVGRELGVRYVLEGSVRKAGTQVRITGQLIDALGLFERAIAIDRDYAPALSWAANCHARLVYDGWAEEPEPSRRKAVDFARQALQVGENDPGVLINAAQVLAQFGEDIGAMMG